MHHVRTVRLTECTVVTKWSPEENPTQRNWVKEDVWKVTLTVLQKEMETCYKLFMYNSEMSLWILIL